MRKTFREGKNKEVKFKLDSKMSFVSHFKNVSYQARDTKISIMKAEENEHGYH